MTRLFKWPDDFINQIICGDTSETLQQMPDGCVDTIITSPPYKLDKAFLYKQGQSYSLFGLLFYRTLDKIFYQVYFDGVLLVIEHSFSLLEDKAKVVCRFYKQLHHWLGNNIEVFLNILSARFLCNNDPQKFFERALSPFLQPFGFVFFRDKWGLGKTLIYASFLFRHILHHLRVLQDKLWFLLYSFCPPFNQAYHRREVMSSGMDK